MKICLVSREYPPETHWGGIGTFTFNLAQGLIRGGHQVDVICMTFGVETSYLDQDVMIYRTRSPGIPFTQKTFWDLSRYCLFPFSFLYSYKIMKKIDQLHRERHYDVIDFPEHIGEGFFTIFFNNYPSLVRLYTPLSLIGELGLQRATNRLDYSLLRIIEKFSVTSATLVNSPSRNLASLVNERFECNRQIPLIYNPIDTDQFAPVAGSTTDGRCVVLFVGRLDDRKGVHILAEAIPAVTRALDHVDFVLLGNDGRDPDGGSSMKAYIQQLLTREGGVDRVSFRSPVAHADLPAQYQAADIMVVPSLYDNSPYTCLEAMACGLPVIGTSAGGMPEYIEDQHSGIIVPPGDAEQLTAAIIALAADSSRRSGYGVAARVRVLRLFDRDVVAQKLTLLYDDAIQLHRRR